MQIILVTIFATISVIFLILSCYMAKRNPLMGFPAEQCDGEIIGFARSKSFWMYFDTKSPVISYHVDDREYRNISMTNSKKLQVGDNVVVQYPQGHPEDGLILINSKNLSRIYYAISLFLAVIGVVMSLPIY